MISIAGMQHDYLNLGFLTNFSSSLLYDEDNATFVDLPLDALDVEPDQKTCFSCNSQDAKPATDEAQVFDDSLILHGTTYHVSDFVYIIPANQTKLLDIGQLIKITKLNVVIRLLGRYDEYVAKQKSSVDGLLSDEVSNLGPIGSNVQLIALSSSVI